MRSESNELRIFFFPLLAYGHMIPMVDLAKTFASRGVKATIILTPLNAAVFARSVEQFAAAGHPIGIHPISFPTPTRLENTDFVTSSEELEELFRGVETLEQPFHDLVEQLRPHCLVSDLFMPWTAEVAARFGITRLGFNGFNYFSLCMWDSMFKFKHDETLSETEPFLVPGLPDPIKLTKAQLADPTRSAVMLRVLEKMKQVASINYGIIVNSFLELEPVYVKHYREVTGNKSWPVGPLSLSAGKDLPKRTDRGKKSSIDPETCISWLDAKQHSSVLYVCFGSIFKFASSQLAEIGAALESSGCSFIWVINENGSLPIGFEEVTKNRGLVIKGWAPQVLIVSHPAVGGFVSHCGWNSALEGISSGLPMITWPGFGDQFYNEKLITEVLKVGVGVGVKRQVRWEVETTEVEVGREAIEKAIRRVMGGGEEAEEMRKRARELGAMAKKAIEKDGSSYLALTSLIDELKSILGKLS